MQKALGGVRDGLYGANRETNEARGRGFLHGAGRSESWAPHDIRSGQAHRRLYGVPTGPPSHFPPLRRFPHPRYRIIFIEGPNFEMLRPQPIAPCSALAPHRMAGPTRLGITMIAGFAGPESVIISLAGFGARRPQPAGGRTAIPALSGTRMRFHDGLWSLAGCAVATTPAVPELRLVVSSLRSRHWPCPRRLQASAGVNVPDAALVGRFSGDTHWPVLGDRASSAQGRICRTR
jgi:hypothetical protein